MSISTDEGLDADKLEQVIGNYLFTEKEPLPNDIIGIMAQKPALKERKPTLDKITHKIYDFVETFISGIGVA